MEIRVSIIMMIVLGPKDKRLLHDLHARSQDRRVGKTR